MDLVRDADTAMYRAKPNGKACYLFGAPVPAEEAAAHLNTLSPVALPNPKAKRGRPPRKKA